MASRIGWLLGGLVLVVPGVLLAGATVPVLANGGFLYTKRESLATLSNAFVFEDVDDRAFDADSWSDGETTNGLRVEARSADGRPLFVGIARGDQVLGLGRFRPPGGNWAPCPHRVPRGYLEGASYQLVGYNTARPVPGARRPLSPDHTRIWADAATGSTASADWKDGPRSSEPCQVGYWYPVVMYADGSPGVRAEVRFGARVLGLAVVGAVIAVALLAAAAILAVKGLRRAQLGSPR